MASASITVRVKAQACIFHHGFDPRTYKSRFSRSAQKRLRLIAKHELTILGFHYSLDAHPQIGNNSVIIRELGAELGEPLFDEWGYIGRFRTFQDVKELSKKCAKLFEHDIFAVYAGPEKVSTIGVVSGSAKPYDAELAEMAAKGVELFITGEPSESVPHRMKESGINYFAGGHYATEVFGVQELGKKLKANFKNKLDVEFIDIPNPI
ncbi:MAG: Nif3-like dinuclear metal center hexameric protein [Candidatus Chisholmbacteria bacterium]|nr:Nif3-like dinuclear metal center hexameric protein [Candidatus Chisholmbacteria bacterium]